METNVLTKSVVTAIELLTEDIACLRSVANRKVAESTVGNYQNYLPTQGVEKRLAN